MKLELFLCRFMKPAFLLQHVVLGAGDSGPHEFTRITK